MRRLILAVAILLLPVAASAQTGPSWSKASPEAAKPAQAAPSDANVGKVLETQNAGGYTYLRIDASGKETWVAVPETKVPTGATVRWAPGAPMQNFTSKTLNRTFPQILFSGGVQVVQ